MAVGKSGYMDVTVMPSSVGKVRVYWREDYDVEGNYSTITVTDIQGYLWHREGSAIISLKVTAGDVTIMNSVRNWVFWASADTAWRSVVSTSDYETGFAPVTSGRIYHNDDGSKSVNLTCSLNECYISAVGFQASGSSADSTVTLTAIPRASGLTAFDGTLGVEQMLVADKKSKEYLHTIQYACGSQEETVVWKVGDTSIPWTPPLSLAAQNTMGRDVKVTLTIHTYTAGGTWIGSNAYDITCRIPDTVGLTVSEGWATVSPYQGETAAVGLPVYIQGYSAASVTFDETKISAANAYGAQIDSYRITCSGKQYASPYRTQTLSTGGDVIVTATVIDSRGYAVNEDLTIHVEAYAKPILSGVEIFRCDGDGQEKDDGQYLSVTARSNISGLAGLNTSTMRLEIGTLMTVEIPNGETVVVGDGLVLSTYTYHVKLILTDLLQNSTELPRTIPTAEAFFHGRQGGRGAAFGKYAEADDLLDVDWNIRVQKGIQIDGDAAIDGALSVGGALTVGGQKVLTSVNPLDFMPVGYIYISGSPTSPAELFGGTWEQLSGRMIVGVGSGTDMRGATWTFHLNDAYGNYEHVLTVNEMPNHWHQIRMGWGSKASDRWGPTGFGTGYNANIGVDEGDCTFATGGNAPHYNMPPYLAKYIWERVE